MDELPTSFGAAPTDRHKSHEHKFKRFQRREYQEHLGQKALVQEQKALFHEQKQNQNQQPLPSDNYNYYNDDDESEYSDSDDGGDDDGLASVFENVPISHNFDLNVNIDNKHEFNTSKSPRSVTSITSNAQGDSFIVGLNAAFFKVYKFAIINPNYDENTPIRTIEPHSGETVNKVLYQPSRASSNFQEENFLCVTSNPRFRLYYNNAEHNKHLEFKPGNQYLYDLKKTNGHTSGVNDCCYNYHDPNYFATAGNDGTVRTWDINTYEKKRKCVDIITSTRRSARDAILPLAKIQKVLYANQNPKTTLKKVIFSADSSGKLCGWDISSPVKSPTLQTAAPLPADLDYNDADPITFTNLSLANLNANYLLTRSTDSAVRIFDVRYFGIPVTQRLDIPTGNRFANCIYSSNDKYVIAGVNEGTSNQLHILDSENLKSVKSFDFGTSQITTVHQNHKINHLLIGTNEGTMSINFNQHNSFSGITKNLDRKVSKRRHVEDNIQINSVQELYEYEQAQAKRQKN